MSRSREKSHSPQQSPKDLRSIISRRSFLIGAAAAGIGLGLGAYISDQLRNDEGNSPITLSGKELNGGEIIPENQLIEKYRQILDNNSPIEVNPTIIRSTLYHAFRFYGMDDNFARRHAQIISITEDSESFCPGTSCSLNSNKGLGIELSTNLFKNHSPDPINWIILLHDLTHEAYHNSINRVRQENNFEDYGPLGSYYGFVEKRGFVRFNEKYDGQTDLIRRQYRLTSKSQYLGTIAEEFMAENGWQRYYKHLLSNGLNQSARALTFDGMTVFEFLDQGLVNTLDEQGSGGHISWQKWWGDSMNPDQTGKLHRQNDRSEFCHGLGQAVLNNNPLQSTFTLPDEDVRAIGVIAFADYADFNLTNYQILTSFINGTVDKQKIQDRASFLKGKIIEREVYLPNRGMAKRLGDNLIFLRKTQPDIYGSLTLRDRMGLIFGNGSGTSLPHPALVALPTPGWQTA